MKYIIILGDGMSDYPIEQLGNKTPLEAANKPNIDSLAAYSEMGLVTTVPSGLAPGSDVANLAAIGYDPAIFYTGRSPLEAISMDVNMLDDDVAIRCNLVTLSHGDSDCSHSNSDYEDLTMLDYSSDEICTEDARILIEFLQERLGNEKYSFHPGISYRHCVIRAKGATGLGLVPPHDILDKKISKYLPKGEINSEILDLMKKSYDLLSFHPLNLDRIANGNRPANSIWLWGEGKRPSLDSFEKKFGLKGVVISAVDLLKGIGKCAGMKTCEVEGATGNIHTNFSGKAEAAIQAFRDGYDFVYLHIEAPDECGHRNEIENKVRSIELIDEKIVAPIIAATKEIGPLKILVMPDHPTPISLRTHTSEPVPYLIALAFDGNVDKNIKETNLTYSEANCASTGIHEENGYKMILKLLS
ncbi:MAG: cofactor-independent phosphoglycerate mutase [Bacillota bacterium]